MYVLSVQFRLVINFQRIIASCEGKPAYIVSKNRPKKLTHEDRGKNDLRDS